MDAPVVTDPTAVDPTPEERTLALLAHLLGIFGFVGPLLVYAVKANDSRFVGYHALQAVVFQVAWLAFVFVVFLPFAFCTFGLGSFLLFLFVPVVFLGSVWAALKANEGLWVGYPFIDWIGRPT